MSDLKLLGGKPAFDSLLSITRPTMPAFSTVEPKLREIYESGNITLGKNVAELERLAAAHLGVKHVIATSSNSTGQMLTLQAWDLGPGEVILPSFSFCMTANVVAWNGLTPVFVDVEPATCNLDPKKVEEAITPRTRAIIGVHLWGNPCRADELADLARRKGLKFLVDAAQSMGSSLKGRKVGGFADAEVFSCSPTKIVTTGEGGLVATNDDELATRVRDGRIYGLRYGPKSDYDQETLGLNARMSEFNAVLGVAAFEALEENLRNRRARFAQYGELISRIPGVTLPSATSGAETNAQYFTCFIDEKGFGLTRDELYHAILSENILAKRYFDPVLHQLSMFKDAPRRDLTVTERMCKRVLSLPLYSHSTPEMIAKVADVVARIQRSAGRVRDALAAHA